MKMTIVVPYRPSRGGMDAAPYTEGQTFKQNPDGTWPWTRGDIIDRTIHILRKNSVWKHDIVIAIDADMEYNKDWLKQYEGVSIFKTDYKSPVGKGASICRLNATVRDAVLSLPDDAFVCYSYISDLICGKNWDLYIDKAWQQFGDDKVYAPMWVEPKKPANITLTHDNIWHGWRKKWCHSLTVPPLPPGRDVFTEADLDNWAKVAVEKDPGSNWVILEKCGARRYGYFCALCLRNKKLKPIIKSVPLGPGWDLKLDDSLNMLKAVVTRSFVYHFHVPVELDNIEVEHREE